MFFYASWGFMSPYNLLYASYLELGAHGGTNVLISDISHCLLLGTYHTV
jgi:hypothetical protein